MRDPAHTDWDLLDCVIRLAVQTGDVEAVHLAARRLAETAHAPGPSSRVLLETMSPLDRISSRLTWALAHTRMTAARVERERAIWGRAQELFVGREWDRSHRCDT